METHAGRRREEGRRIDEGEDGEAPGLGRVARRLYDEARDAATDLRERVDLDGRVERNPLGMVAAAAGVGFILGGGVFRPWAARVFRVGVRLAILPLLKAQVGAIVEPIVDELARERARAEPSGRPKEPAREPPDV